MRLRMLLKSLAAVPLTAAASYDCTVRPCRTYRSSGAGCETGFASGHVHAVLHTGIGVIGLHPEI